MKEIQKRIDYLRIQLNRHNRLYYIEATPEISDFEYDKLYAELVGIEAKYPELVTADSPTLRVGGAPLSSFEHITHAVPMMSLDNTYSHEEICDLDKMLHRLLEDRTFTYILEPKVDGVAFTLRYEDGLLISAGTRGDGIRGDNVTANVRTIKSIPLRIETDAAVVEVRGEVFMDKQKFLELTEKQTAAGKEPFKNPRNATAGSLKQLDSRIVATRPLDAVLYACGQLDGITFETHKQFLLQLKKWGFPTVDRFWTCSDIDEVITSIEELQTMRHDFPFEIDGAVVKVNQIDLHQKLGSTAKSPRWAKAFKYPPEQAETVVRDITVQVGRTGVLTPVAELEPIFLSGSEISRATLHNAEHRARKDIRVGDHVMIEKAGEVIPAVVSVLKNKRLETTQKFKMPATCPACGEPAIQRPDEVALRCENLQCPAQTVRLLRHFASRNCLDIEALGNIVAEKLVEREMVKTPLDLFNLKLFELGCLNLGTQKDPRTFGEKNASKLIDAVNRARTMPLDRWLFALGIPRIGKTVSFNLARIHKDLISVSQSEIIPGFLEFLDMQSSTLHKIKGMNKEIRATKGSNGNKKDLSQNIMRLRAEGSPAPENDLKNDGDSKNSADAKNGAGVPSPRTLIQDTILDSISQFNTELEQAAKTFVDLDLLKISAKKHTTKNVDKTYITTSIGSESAKTVLKFFDSKRGQATLQQLAELGINPTSAAASSGTSLSGSTFVLTGTLTTMKRDEAADAIRSNGGSVTTTVTSKTTYLVAGANTGAKKTEKAQSLNVKVIDEETLVQMIAIEIPTAVIEPEKPKIQKPDQQQMTLF